MNPLTSFAIRIPVYFFGALVVLLPRRVELALGRFLGRCAYRVAKKRAAVARDNLSKCYPERSAAGIETLLEENFCHLGILFIELLHLFSPIKNHYREYVKRNSFLIGIENWKKAHARGRGVIFVSSHLGNWEFMTAVGGMAGIELTMVTKRLKPVWLHSQVENTRRSTGVSGAYEPRTLQEVLRALRKGAAVGFVMDQYAGPPIGIPVKFFGVEVGTLSAVGKIAAKTGASVLTVKTFRRRDGIIQVEIEPELDLENVIADEKRSTQALTSRVEDWVRAEPTQWLWTHRRFKNVNWNQKQS